MRASLTIQRENNAPLPAAEDRRLLRRAAKEALLAAGCTRDGEISLLFTDNEGIQALNRAYRDKDQPTDVLSFALAEGEDAAFSLPPAGPLMLGDIVISYEKAAAQAEAYGHSVQRETVFLFVHGMLHLLGYDHEQGEAEEKAMFALQDQIMAKLGR